MTDMLDHALDFHYRHVMLVNRGYELVSVEFLCEGEPRPRAVRSEASADRAGAHRRYTARERALMRAEAPR